MKRLLGVFVGLGLLMAAPASALELPFCQSDDDLIPIPRWEVEVDSQYQLSTVPPAQEGRIVHLLLSFPDLDRDACTALSGGKNFLYPFSEDDPESADMVITIREAPTYGSRGCMVDGLYAFGELEEAGGEEEGDGAGVVRFQLHLQPDWSILESGRFCKMVQEG